MRTISLLIVGTVTPGRTLRVRAARTQTRSGSRRIRIRRDIRVFSLEPRARSPEFLRSAQRQSRVSVPRPDRIRHSRVNQRKTNTLPSVIAGPQPIDLGGLFGFRGLLAELSYDERM